MVTWTARGIPREFARVRLTRVRGCRAIHDGHRREPHYRASAAVLEAAVDGRIGAALPSHAITILHDVVERYQDDATARRVVGWLLHYFEIAPVGRQELDRALQFGLDDFEDAVVAASGESAKCTAIVTRNVRDFDGSPIRALTPSEFLLELEG